MIEFHRIIPATERFDSSVRLVIACNDDDDDDNDDDDDATENLMIWLRATISSSRSLYFEVVARMDLMFAEQTRKGTAAQTDATNCVPPDARRGSFAENDGGGGGGGSGKGPDSKWDNGIRRLGWWYGGTVQRRDLRPKLQYIHTMLSACCS